MKTWTGNKLWYLRHWSKPSQSLDQSLIPSKTAFKKVQYKKKTRLTKLESIYIKDVTLHTTYLQQFWDPAHTLDTQSYEGKMFFKLETNII